MKRKYRFLMMGLTFMILLAGCTTSPPPPENNNPQEPVPPPQEEPGPEETEKNFKVIQEGDLPEMVKEWMAQYEQEQGAYIYQHPDGIFVKIVAGEKPTGGYGIEVKSYDPEAYPRKITVAVSEPAPGSINTQVLTYPSVLIEIEPDQVSQYEVTDEAGQVFEVTEKLEFAQLELPQADEAIGNPVQIKGKIIVFEGAFIVRILDEDGGLIHEEPAQASAGGPFWGTFDKEISYPEQAPGTGTLQLGEYSAKDGEYVLILEIPITFQ